MGSARQSRLGLEGRSAALQAIGAPGARRGRVSRRLGTDSGVRHRGPPQALRRVHRSREIPGTDRAYRFQPGARGRRRLLPTDDRQWFAFDAGGLSSSARRGKADAPNRGDGTQDSDRRRSSDRCPCPNRRPDRHGRQGATGSGALLRHRRFAASVAVFRDRACAGSERSRRGCGPPAGRGRLEPGRSAPDQSAISLPRADHDQRCLQQPGPPCPGRRAIRTLPHRAADDRGGAGSSVSAYERVTALARPGADIRCTPTFATTSRPSFTASEPAEWVPIRGPETWSMRGFGSTA